MFTAVGAAAPYLPVYYQSLGMSLEQIGLLAAVLALSALFAAPLWGLVGDRLHATRLALPAAAISAALLAGALGLANEPLIAAFVAVFFWSAYAGVGPLLDTRALETVAEDQHRYGRLRAWGSAAFVVSSIGVGILVQGSGIRSLFIVLIGGLLVTAILAFGLRPQASRQQLPRLSGLAAVLRDRVLMTFLAAALIAWAANSAINAFFSIYLTQIGASGSLIGLAWAIGAAVEIPLMLAFPFLARRVGVERLILTGAALLLLRALALAIVRDPVLVALTMLLHGGGFALLLVGSVTYIARHSPRGATATAQGVLSGVVVGLAPVLGPGLGGIFATNSGLSSLFAVAAGVGAFAIVLLALVLGVRSPARTEGDATR